MTYEMNEDETIATLACHLPAGLSMPAASAVSGWRVEDISRFQYEHLMAAGYRLVMTDELHDELYPPPHEPLGLCGNKEDHEPHWHNATVGRIWCHADQSRRLPYAAEVARNRIVSPILKEDHDSSAH